MTKGKAGRQSLESALKRLETIVNSLEGGDVPLDEAIALYEEGLELSKVCGERLKETELRLRKLSKTVDGRFELTDME